MRATSANTMAITVIQKLWSSGASCSSTFVLHPEERQPRLRVPPEGKLAGPNLISHLPIHSYSQTHSQGLSKRKVGNMTRILLRKFLKKREQYPPDKSTAFIFCTCNESKIPSGR